MYLVTFKLHVLCQCECVNTEIFTDVPKRISKVIQYNMQCCTSKCWSSKCIVILCISQKALF